jgi:hypothetical protein
MSSGVKWSPAVGAATLHDLSISLYTVWYRSSGDSESLIYGGSGVSHIFSTSSKNSFQAFVNSTILHFSLTLNIFHIICVHGNDTSTSALSFFPG